LVISFHVQDKNYTGIGGSIEEEFRKAVSDEMDKKIRNRYEFRYKHNEMRWKGVSDENLVNKLCSEEGGLQVEMQPIIGYKYRKKAANSVFKSIEERF
jgi:phage replication-related protein YjqB (UPF0714/DUF867 family)